MVWTQYMEAAMPYDPARTRFVPEVDLPTRIDPVIAFFEQGPDYWCKYALRDEKRRCPRKVLDEMGIGVDLDPIIMESIVQITGRRYESIPRFNDCASTTYAVLMMVLYKTRENLLLREGGSVVPVSPWFMSEVWNKLTYRVRRAAVGPFAAIIFVLQA